MSKTTTSLSLLTGMFCVASLYAGCSDSDEPAATTAGTAGTTSAGSSGSAGTTSGSSGTAGTAGTAGTGSSGGTAGTGGTGGTDAAYFAPGDTIDGKTFAEMSAAWWKWFLAIPNTGHPAEGGDCTVQQSGSVWFLAGTTSGMPATRTCAIPAGKIVFFPLTNSVCFPCPESAGCSTPQTQADLTSCAHVDGTDLAVSLDGTAFDNLDAYHFTSSEFSFTAPANASDQEFACIGPIAANACNIPTGDRFGVSDGYWFALKPLSAGTHTLHFAGTNPIPPPFVEDVTFTLTVQ